MPTTKSVHEGRCGSESNDDDDDGGGFGGILEVDGDEGEGGTSRGIDGGVVVVPEST